MGGASKFMRPRGAPQNGEQRSPNLYVANCGPAVGLSLDAISSVFSTFGDVKGVDMADESGARVVVSFSDVGSAQAAMEALDGRPCSQLLDRFLHVRYSVPRPISPGQGDSVEVSLTASELNIPGLYLFHDFITAKEEEELLAAVDNRPWISLAKRRVQHYGYEFCYQTRNVDVRRRLGELPLFISSVLQRISTCPGLDDAANINLDQLTVNEYPPGVGLSPHIDTHSAFEDMIFSLSLAGPCIMELRRYQEGIWQNGSCTSHDTNAECQETAANVTKKAIYLPPRSMLLLSGEARYAWHHYIPHHKVDNVKEKLIRRSSRRVSFTLRKVRKGPCCCKYAHCCDSHRS